MIPGLGRSEVVMKFTQFIANPMEMHPVLEVDSHVSLCCEFEAKQTTVFIPVTYACISYTGWWF